MKRIESIAAQWRLGQNTSPMATEPRSKRPQYTRPVAIATLAMAIDATQRSLKIFVAGPYIRRQDSKGEIEETEISTPAALRIKIIGEVEGSLGHDVILGEHRGIIEAGEQQLRSRSSVLTTEIVLVNSADAIIIIPSSPGSFSELGTWVVREDLCRKMLILADKNFEDDKSYLNLGVFPTAKHNGAKLEWLDYLDHEAAVKIVSDYIAETQDAVLTRSIMRGYRNET